MMRWRLSAWGLLACLIAGCAGSVPRLQWPEGNPEAVLRRTQQRLTRERTKAAPASARETPRHATMVAFTHGEGARLLAFDFEGGNVRWRRTFQARAKPRIAGNTVFTADTDHVVGFDLRDGRTLWRAPTHGLKLVGGARDGTHLIYALRSASLRERAEARLVCIDARDGDVHWERRIVGWVGAPVATAGLGFVPWNRQSLAVIDLASGKPWLHLRPASGGVEWSETVEGDVLFGDSAVHRVGAIDALPVAAQSEPSSAYAELPADPALHPSAYRWVPATRSAMGRIALHAPLDDVSGGEAGSRTAYFVYYRYVFGLLDDGTLSWVRILPHDVVSARRVADGLQVVLEPGDALVLNAGNGHARRRWRIPSAIASVGFAGEFDAAATTETSRPAEPLRDSLASVALDPDNRLIAARAFAIRRLAALSSPQATRDLLDLYVQRSMPAMLRQQIIEALKGRERGRDYVVEALQRQQDFLADTRPPPLEALIPAVVAMQARDAVPALARHLLDPATPVDVLAPLADAIRELGNIGVAPALRDFLALYRADSALRDQPQALVAVARALRQHGDREDREHLASIARQPDTHAALRRSREQPADQETRAVAKKPTAPAEDLPRWLEQRHIDATFAERAKSLRDCIRSALRRRPQLYQVRIAFLLQGDGRASDVHVTPASKRLRSCLGDIVSELRFPRFAARRQMADYVVTLREPRAPEPQRPEKDAQDAQPWWAWQASHAAPVEGSRTKSPWWLPALRHGSKAPARAKDESKGRRWWQIEAREERSEEDEPRADAPASRAERPWWELNGNTENVSSQPPRKSDAEEPDPGPTPWWKSAQP